MNSLQIEANKNGLYWCKLQEKFIAFSLRCSEAEIEFYFSFFKIHSVKGRP